MDDDRFLTVERFDHERNDGCLYGDWLEVWVDAFEGMPFDQLRAAKQVLIAAVRDVPGVEDVRDNDRETFTCLARRRAKPSLAQSRQRHWPT